MSYYIGISYHTIRFSLHTALYLITLSNECRLLILNDCALQNTEFTNSHGFNAVNFIRSLNLLPVRGEALGQTNLAFYNLLSSTGNMASSSTTK